MDLEKADFGGAAPGGPACVMCQRSLVAEYFQVGAATLCSACASIVRAGPAKGGSARRVFKAFAYGSGAGLLGAGVYAAVLYGLNVQAALITIGIGWLVGRGVMAGSEHRGGRGYQVLAAFLTYMMCTEALAPSIYAELVAGEPQAMSVVAGLFAVVLAPAAPFLNGFDALGWLILGFGVWQGWKFPAATVVDVTGPFQLAIPPTHAEPAASDGGESDADVESAPHASDELSADATLAARESST